MGMEQALIVAQKTMIQMQIIDDMHNLPVIIRMRSVKHQIERLKMRQALLGCEEINVNLELHDVEME